MEKLNSCCGLDCKSCEAYKATQSDDDSLREKVAKEWSELNQVTITKEMINCDGCLANGRKTPFCDALCPIRQCVISKSKESCKGCENLEGCEKIKMIISSNVEAKKRLLGE